MISREKIRKIKALVPDQRAMRQARDRWDKVAMPLDGLGTCLLYTSDAADEL